SERRMREPGGLPSYQRPPWAGPMVATPAPRAQTRSPSYNRPSTGPLRWQSRIEDGLRSSIGEVSFLRTYSHASLLALSILLVACASPSTSENRGSTGAPV